MFSYFDRHVFSFENGIVNRFVVVFFLFLSACSPTQDNVNACNFDDVRKWHDGQTAHAIGVSNIEQFDLDSMSGEWHDGVFRQPHFDSAKKKSYIIPLVLKRGCFYKVVAGTLRIDFATYAQGSIFQAENNSLVGWKLEEDIYANAHSEDGGPIEIHLVHDDSATK